jgi:hypothetical protein
MTSNHGIPARNAFRLESLKLKTRCEQIQFQEAGPSNSWVRGSASLGDRSLALALTIWLGLLTGLPAGKAATAPANWLYTKMGTSYLVKGLGLTVHDYQGCTIVLAQSARLVKLDKDFIRPNTIAFQSNDWLLVKFGPDKRPLCLSKVGEGDFPYFVQLVTDRQGNIYGLGNFRGNARIEDGSTSHPLPNQGKNDFLLAQWNSKLEFVFARAFGGPDYEYAHGLALSSQGHLILSGTFMGSLSLPGIGATPICLSGQQLKYDYFIADMTFQGQCHWARRVGGADSLIPSAIGVDPDGNCLLTGGFETRLQFDGAPDSANLRSRGMSDFFLVKYLANGDFAWARQGGGTNEDYGVWALVDEQGGCYLTGRYGPGAWFGEGPTAMTLAAKADADMFMACYDSQGNLAGALRVGGPGPWVDRHWTIVWDELGNRYLVGKTAQPAQLWRFSATPAQAAKEQPSQTAQADSRSRFDAIARAPDGSIQILLSNPRTAVYVIEASADLNTWIPISTNQAPGGQLVIKDFLSSGAPMGFFRVRQP